MWLQDLLVCFQMEWNAGEVENKEKHGLRIPLVTSTACLSKKQGYNKDTGMS